MKSTRLSLCTLLLLLPLLPACSSIRGGQKAFLLDIASLAAKHAAADGCGGLVITHPEKTPAILATLDLAQAEYASGAPWSAVREVIMKAFQDPRQELYVELALTIIERQVKDPNVALSKGPAGPAFLAAVAGCRAGVLANQPAAAKSV